MVGLNTVREVVVESRGRAPREVSESSRGELNLEKI